MSARGVLCRLAADIPRTSTHDLACISRVFHRAVLTRNATSIASVGGLSHAYKLAYAVSRRSYATATAKTPAKTVKKATVKKTVAKKPAAKKTVATKKPAAKKKAAPKKKRAAKKAAPKKKPAKRVLTEAGKARKKISEERAHLKELKETALTAPRDLPYNAWLVYVSELQKKAKGSDTLPTEVTKQAAAQFKALTAAEREHYNHLANQNKAANEAAYRAWILSYTPEQIRLANNARRAIRDKYTKLKDAGKKTSRRYPKETNRLQDERQVKRAMNAFLNFNVERRASGEMKGIKSVDASKLIGTEWKALSPSEKKKYEDLALAQRKQYSADFTSTYGRQSRTAVA
ncbi:uncharacterized protein BDZ99DRAFT_477959 [Mytilinidion resinicola]|uniref:HMG box domain-containing protein n=1 Tax=Mytilinidion resinicola TaxID=574789 RepID=A0A6A6YHZ2_9PEZI|nr:uncharacterized protein BDZ99DRAFT_477959 [Mytilinidion resinicola]KAF2808452.1 hypothetical protein BDZ99DRAFT_477959 [Mytilinidion resinicola]